MPEATIIPLHGTPEPAPRKRAPKAKPPEAPPAVTPAVAEPHVPSAWESKLAGGLAFLRRR
ncbi:MAG: hypothetical protein JWM40_203, partial [Frankiales bacterium]|nr:hypothetical protein [Frankiales bacterium]